MAETTSYSARFQDQEAVADYESKEYAPDSYASHVWQWQRPVVEQIARTFQAGRPAPVRLLDFACGTGRVLECVEPFADVVEGVDISEKMIARARAKCRKAQFKTGDIVSQPELLRDKYDLITAFRFLLNADPALRRPVLRKLREVVREPEGLLLVNVHGNLRSLRHPAIVWRRRRERARPTGAMLNEMSPGQAKTLLRECGFQVVRQLGFGILPPTLYRTPFRRLAVAVDRLFAGDNIWRNCSIDMLFICKPC